MGDSGKNEPGGKVGGGARISTEAPTTATSAAAATTSTIAAAAAATTTTATATTTASVLTHGAVVAPPSTSKRRARSLFVHGWNSSGEKLKSNSKDLLKALADDGCFGGAKFITSPFNVTESQAAAVGAKDSFYQWWSVEKVVDAAHPTISGFRQTFDTLHDAADADGSKEGSLSFLRNEWNKFTDNINEENSNISAGGGGGGGGEGDTSDGFVLFAFSQGTLLALQFLLQIESGQIKVRRNPCLVVLICPFLSHKNPDLSALKTPIVLVHGGNDPLVTVKDRLPSPEQSSVVRTLIYKEGGHRIPSKDSKNTIAEIKSLVQIYSSGGVVDAVVPPTITPPPPPPPTPSVVNERLRIGVDIGGVLSSKGVEGHDAVRADVPFAIETLEKLQREHNCDLFIISYGGRRRSGERCDYYFSEHRDLFKHQYYVDKRRCKADVLKYLNCDVIIDDRQEILDQARIMNPNILCIAFERYNTRAQKHNHKVANSWKGFVDGLVVIDSVEAIINERLHQHKTELANFNMEVPAAAPYRLDTDYRLTPMGLMEGCNGTWVSKNNGEEVKDGEEAKVKDGEEDEKEEDA